MKPTYNDFYDDEENVFRRLRLSTATHERNELTQTELSKIFKDEIGISITQGQISKLEKDRLKEIPSRDVLEAYRTYFGVSTDYLLGFTDKRTTNMDMIKVSSVTGLSEKSLIVLDYLRKFKGITNTATGLINYSTIKCINYILESYYKDVISSMNNYCDDKKRIMEDCIVYTLFSKIDEYFNSQTATCNVDKVYMTRNNISYSINIESMYEMLSEKAIIKELDKLKNNLQK